MQLAEHTFQEAHRLIMQHAHDIGEGEGRSYNEMVQDLVEVNVRDVSLSLKQLRGSKLIF